MSEKVTNFINSVKQQDYATAKSEFQTAMAERVNSAFENRKIELAKNMTENTFTYSDLDEAIGDSLFGMHNLDDVNSIIDKVRQVNKTLTKGGYKTSNQKIKDALAGKTSNVKQDGNRGAVYKKSGSPEVVVSYGRDLKGNYFVNVEKK